MKTTNRVHRNGATKPAPSQAKIHNEFAIPRDAGHPSCLAIYDREGKGLVSKIPLSEDDFCKLIMEPHRRGSEFQDMETEDLVAQAIREKLSVNTSQVNAALSELEIAKNQSIALARLMLDSETHHLMEGDLNHAERDRMNAGVSDLVRQSSARLDAAFNSLFSALRPKREEAAS